MINDQQNDELEENVTKEEKKKLYSFKKYKSLDPNGWTMEFYLWF